jgi:hypothetical protein
MRETAVAVGVAAVIAGLGGAAIYAATDGDSHSMGGAHQPFGGPGGPGGQHFGPIGGPGGSLGGQGAAPMPLHGEFVVPDGSGGYATELTQTGTVRAISPTSVTVLSEDGFSQTYVIPPSAQAQPAMGDRVVVHATRTGRTATVTDIGPGGPPHR